MYAVLAKARQANMMDLRKVTRNPGWWRLFIVFAGLWYGGWLIGAVVTFSEEMLGDTPRSGTALFSKLALSEGMKRAWVAGDTEAAIAIGNKINNPLKAPVGFVLEDDLWAFKKYIYPFDDPIGPPTPWYMDRDLKMLAAVVVLFPWIVFFNLRLMRYVIEGFIPERD